jgi:hypothetical protein
MSAGLLLLVVAMEVMVAMVVATVTAVGVRRLTDPAQDGVVAEVQLGELAITVLAMSILMEALTIRSRWYMRLSLW